MLSADRMNASDRTRSSPVKTSSVYAPRPGAAGPADQLEQRPSSRRTPPKPEIHGQAR